MSNVINMFDYKLRKGDVVGAIDNALLEADQALQEAQEGLAKISESEKRMREVTRKALDKYPTL